MGETFDLSTLFDRDEVKLRGGKMLEIKNKQEFSILERRRLDFILKKIKESDAEAAEDGKTEEDLDALAERGSKLLHDLAHLVLVEPPEELEDWECASIFAFWVARSAQGVADPSPQTPTPRRQPAKKKPTSSRKRGSAKSSSSRASRSSTAAPRKRGSTPRRGS